MKGHFLWEFIMITNQRVATVMKKEAKRKARIEQRRAKKLSTNPKEAEQETMHDINKPITLEDLTNPDKIKKEMKSLKRKISFLKKRETALKKI